MSVAAAAAGGEEGRQGSEERRRQTEMSEEARIVGDQSGNEGERRYNDVTMLRQPATLASLFARLSHCLPPPSPLLPSPPFLAKRHATSSPSLPRTLDTFPLLLHHSRSRLMEREAASQLKQRLPCANREQEGHESQGWSVEFAWTCDRKLPHLNPHSSSHLELESSSSMRRASERRLRNEWTRVSIRDSFLPESPSLV